MIMMTAGNYQRLASTIPILSTNLIESGVVDAEFNRSLTQAAIDAFQNFTNFTSSTSYTQSKQDDIPSSSGRRKRRARTSSAAFHTTNNMISPPTSDNGKQVTPNDNFFEYQRTRGYRLSTPNISTCNAAIQLEEDHVANAIAHYLTEVAKIHTINNNHNSLNNITTTIADELDSSQVGLSIDMWAAVQKGVGAYHEYHVHEGAIVSGVYYSNCPSGCAPLVLKMPTENAHMIVDTKQLGKELSIDDDDDEDMIIQPKEGQLVLFPPWLYHGVPRISTDKCATENARVSWAFNLNARLVADPWSVTQCV